MLTSLAIWQELMEFHLKLTGLIRREHIQDQFTHQLQVFVQQIKLICTLMIHQLQHLISIEITQTLL